MASDLEKVCEDLLASLKDAPAISSMAHSSARELDSMAAEVDHVARDSEQSVPSAVLHQLHSAASDCRAIASHLEAAESMAKEFVRRAVGGAYEGGDDSGGFAGEAKSESSKLSRCGSQHLLTDNGSSYFESGEQLRDLAMQTDRVVTDDGKEVMIDGCYLVSLHGSPSVVGVGEDRLDAGELAELINSTSEWDGKQPILLGSCNTGNGRSPIAKQLADQLGVPVFAPDHLCWYNSRGAMWSASGMPRVNADGSEKLATKWPPDGKWHRYIPTDRSGR